MLGWFGFLGKLVEFSIKKVADKKLDLALDQRKQAARSFLSLYESLEQLEHAALDFIHESQRGLSSESKRVLYRVPIEKIAKDIDKASVLFFNSFENLRQVISLYDEELYKMLWGIQAGKREIASVLSTLKKESSFRTSNDSPSVFSILYSRPSDELLSQSFEKLYQSAREIAPVDFLRLDPLGSVAYERWPKNLLFSLVEEPALSVQFSDNDREYIAYFVEKLEQHLKLLQSSRQKLAEFIKSSFSLDDLLYCKTLSKFN